MSKYHIARLDQVYLDTKQLAQLLTDSKTAIAATTKTNRSETYLTTTLPRFEEKLALFEAGAHKIKTSTTAQKLAETDAIRDKAFSTISKLIRAYSTVPTEAIAKGYQLLAPLLKNYKITANTSYEEESEMLRHFLKEISNEKYQTALTNLHLQDHISSLRVAQINFEKAYKDRLSEQTTQTPSQTRQLRKELTELYTTMVDYIAINAHCHPERAHLATLRDQLNTIRKRYAIKKSSKEKPTPPVTEGE